MQAARTKYSRFFIALLAALSAAFSAAAAPDTKAPELMSRLHCTLLLQSLKTEPLSAAILEQQIGGLLSQYSTDYSQHLTYLARMEFLPEFGFIIGGRWDSMTQSERIRFNRAFALYLGDHYRLEKFTHSECAMNTTIYGAPEAAKDEEALPMRALAYTQLMNEKTRITLIYSFNFLPSEGWQLSDITIQDRSLITRYRIRLNGLIQKGGTSHIERLVQSLSD